MANARGPGPSEQPAEAYGLSDEVVREVAEALEGDETERAAERVLVLHAADQADLLQLLSREHREMLVSAVRSRLEPEVLSYLDQSVRAEVIGHLGPQTAGALVARLETDDAVDILQGLADAHQMALLEVLPAQERETLEQSLAHPEASAGRLMQRRLVAVPDYWSVGQTIDYLRAAADLPDDFYDIYLVNPRFEAVGSIPLSKVLRSVRAVPLRELKLKDFRPIPVDMDQEEVAFLFRQYGLVSAPVVAPGGRLIGVVTVDDIVEVIEEEAEEDILKLGGVQETGIFSSPWQSSRQRVPWLLLSLVSATIGATVIHQFEASIERLVALAVLMPVIVALGGNAGVQTLAVVVRALAVKELTRANAMRVLGKELAVGGLNSTALVVVGGSLTLLWFGSPGLALVFAGAIAITVSVAALIGISVPLLLDRLGFDPAIASSVFVTPTIDAIGFLAFLGLATWYLL